MASNEAGEGSSQIGGERMARLPLVGFKLRMFLCVGTKGFWKSLSILSSQLKLYASCLLSMRKVTDELQSMLEFARDAIGVVDDHLVAALCLDAQRLADELVDVLEVRFRTLRSGENERKGMSALAG